MHETRIREHTDAKKVPIGGAKALALAKSASKVIVITMTAARHDIPFDMKNDPPKNDSLIRLMTGRSGNLRAPTLRKGKTLVVGFSEKAYEEILGK